MDPDDDPLTSPSFPKVPASDSRSYHSGRADTPAAGSRVPRRHLEPTQQFTSYGPAAPHRAAARHASGQHTLPGFDRETDRTNPNGYLPDPRLDGNPYPRSGASAPSAPVSPVPVPPVPVPPAPAPPAPIASPSGNPYGSYVTPGSHASAVSYDDYSGMSGNGHGSYLPAAVPGDNGHAGNGYWQPTARGYPPGASASGYQGGPAQDPGAHDVGADAAYRNGHGRHHQTTYLPGGYPAAAGSQDQAGYARQDPYGHNGYGGYPEYGTPGH